MTAWIRDVYNNKKCRKNNERSISEAYLRFRVVKKVHLFWHSTALHKKDLDDYSSSFYTYLRNKNKYIPILLTE